jgi:hypothetical protein
MQLTGYEHVCSKDMLEREVVDPKFDCFPAASMRDPSSATPAQQWAARRGQRGGHGAPGSPTSAAQRRATSSPVLSSTPASAQSLDPALREQALHQQVDALKSFVEALTERQLYDELKRFMQHERDALSQIRFLLS